MAHQRSGRAWHDGKCRSSGMCLDFMASYDMTGILTFTRGEAGENWKKLEALMLGRGVISLSFPVNVLQAV